MNSVQTTYVKKRIEEIYATKSQEIKNKFRWVAPVLSLEEKLERVKQGKFTLKVGKNFYNSLDTGLEFEGLSNPNIKAEVDAFEHLRKERTRLMDQLVLGDVDEALIILADFEKVMF